MFKEKKVRLRLRVFQVLILMALLVIIGVILAVVYGGMEETVFAHGRLESLHDYKFRSLHDGRVVEVLVDDGDFVKKGDLIARFDASELTDEIELLSGKINELRAQLEVKKCEIAILETDPLPPRYRHIGIDHKEAQHQFHNAREKLNVYERLVKKNAVSKLDYSRIKMEYAIMEARVKRAEKDKKMVASGLAKRYVNKAKSELNLLKVCIDNLIKKRHLAKTHLKDFEIHAPSKGLITDIHVKNGQYMKAGELLGRMSAHGPKKLVAYVDESMIRKVRKGQIARIESNSYSHFEFGHFQGKVIDIGELPVQHGQDYYYLVDILIDSEPYNLKLGSGAEVEIITGRQRIVSVLLGLDKS